MPSQQSNFHSVSPYLSKKKKLEKEKRKKGQRPILGNSKTRELGGFKKEGSDKKKGKVSKNVKVKARSWSFVHPILFLASNVLLHCKQGMVLESAT
jgi:hypothetical protein